MYYFNSTINPILYNVMSRKYRKFFKRTVYRCLRMRNAEYAETSVYRSTPQSTSASMYTNNRLVVRTRPQTNGNCCEVESSTV